MRRLSVVVALLVMSSTADAKVLDLYVQAQGGGGYGRGISGAQQADDFFEKSAGASYGARIGVEALWLDGWIEHNQFTVLDGVQGTWTQFMAGADFDAEVGEKPAPDQPAKTFFEMGFAIGFGVGTGAQVDPPLDNAQVTDKGFLAQLSFGADYRFNKLVSLGLTVPITYAYLFKKCPDCASNDESNQYQSVSALAMVHLRFHIELK
jgi:hypothetical protein